jgi:Uri superfamily endonuclease
MLSDLLENLFKGFDEIGASDCKCKTHLFYSSSDPSNQLENLLKERGFEFQKIFIKSKNQKII